MIFRSTRRVKQLIADETERQMFTGMLQKGLNCTTHDSDRAVLRRYRGAAGHLSVQQLRGTGPDAAGIRGVSE